MFQRKRMRWHKAYSSVKPNCKIFCTSIFSNYYGGTFPTETNAKSKNIATVKNFPLEGKQTSLYMFPHNYYSITSSKPMGIYKCGIDVTPYKVVRNIVQIAVFWWTCMIHSWGNNAIFDD